MTKPPSAYHVGRWFSLSFLSVWNALACSPALALTVVLTLAVVLVNGWTDAPNAIATAVASGALSFRSAVGLAAVCNFLGVWLVSAVSPAVANTIYSIADFGGDPAAALTALTAAMAAIVLWAAAAWCFGIPTSESHALVAGVTGAAVALQGSFSAIAGQAWGKVLFGLVFSLTLGFLLGGWLACRLPKRGNYRSAQILGAGLMSFLHGGQDGQKFLGIFLLGTVLSGGGRLEAFPTPPLWLTVLVAVTMALGTLLGGRRIIDTVCRDLTLLPPREGFAADLGAGLCLLAATLLGLPVSTTHAKTASIFGAGLASKQGADGKIAGRIGAVWLLTFPVCFVIGYLSALLVLH